MIFMAKFGIEIGFMTSYFASFTDTRIFPLEKRATAIGICKFMARGLCGLAPIVNEFPEPIPIGCFASILVIAFAYNISLNLPEVKKEELPIIGNVSLSKKLERKESLRQANKNDIKTLKKA